MINSMEFMSCVFIKYLAWLMFQGKHSYGYPLLVIQNVQSFLFFFFQAFSFFFLVLNAGEGK